MVECGASPSTIAPLAIRAPKLDGCHPRDFSGALITGELAQ
jgi:hypothetical protein